MGGARLKKGCAEGKEGKEHSGPTQPNGEGRSERAAPAHTPTNGRNPADRGKGRPVRLLLLQPAAAVIGHPASICIAVQSSLSRRMQFALSSPPQSSPICTSMLHEAARSPLPPSPTSARPVRCPHVRASRATSRPFPQSPRLALHKRAPPLNWPRPGALAISLTCKSAGQE